MILLVEKSKQQSPMDLIISHHTQANPAFWQSTAERLRNGPDHVDERIHCPLRGPQLMVKYSSRDLKIRLITSVLFFFQAQRVV